MAEIQYRGARVLRYECNDGVQQNRWGLKELCMSDVAFEKILKTDKLVGKVFKKVIDGDTDEEVEIADELERAVMVSIEMGLENRARFAVLQKDELAHCYSHLSPDLKQITKSRADAELEYASWLLRRLRSAKMLHAKEVMSNWLNIELDDDDEGSDGSDEDDESEDEGTEDGVSVVSEVGCITDEE